MRGVAPLPLIQLILGQLGGGQKIFPIFGVAAWIFGMVTGGANKLHTHPIVLGCGVVVRREALAKFPNTRLHTDGGGYHALVRALGAQRLRQG